MTTENYILSASPILLEQMESNMKYSSSHIRDFLINCYVNNLIDSGYNTTFRPEIVNKINVINYYIPMGETDSLFNQDLLDKLNTIEYYLQKNVIPDWNLLPGSPLYIDNKPEIITPEYPVEYILQDGVSVLNASTKTLNITSRIVDILIKQPNGTNLTAIDLSSKKLYIDFTNKQDKLTALNAGTNISIDLAGVISATTTVLTPDRLYSSENGSGLIGDTNTYNSTLTTLITPGLVLSVNDVIIFLNSYNAEVTSIDAGNQTYNLVTIFIPSGNLTFLTLTGNLLDNTILTNLLAAKLNTSLLPSTGTGILCGSNGLYSIDPDSLLYVKGGVPTDNNYTNAEKTRLLGMLNNATLNTGTVTSVNASAPLGMLFTGGPITTTGTLLLLYLSGYTGYTITEQSKLAGVLTNLTLNIGTIISSNNTVLDIVKVSAMPLTPVSTTMYLIPN